MSARPFRQNSSYELKKHADANEHSIDIQRIILDELAHRRTRYAMALREKLSLRVQQLEHQLTFVDEYLQNTEILAAAVVSNEFGIDAGDQLRDLVVGCAGEDPYEVNQLRSLVFWLGGTNSDFEIWAHNMIVVLGKYNYNEDDLIKTIQIMQEYDIAVHFLSQEAFMIYVFEGEITTYFPNDPRIADHPGLSFLASIGFRWPSTFAAIRSGEIGYSDYDYDAHPLSAVFKYTVRKGTSRAARQRSLHNAVRPWPYGLGLKEVTMHIAYIVKNRKQYQPERLRKAISCWEEDLAWLHEHYYRKSIHSFTWPSF